VRLVDPETQDRQLRELVAAEASRRFSLDSGPCCVRLGSTSWGADQYALVVLVHHIAIGGWREPAAGTTSRGIQQRWQHIAAVSYWICKTQRAVWSRRRKGSTTGVTARGGATLALHTIIPANVLSYPGRGLRRPVDPDLING